MAKASAAAPLILETPDAMTCPMVLGLRRTRDPSAVGQARARYVRVLGWLFAAFNVARVLTYLPSIWIVHASGDSSQHSAATWMTWVGANLTMLAWLYEHNGRRIDRSVLATGVNTAMCISMLAAILWVRIG
jgi:hypothetical protein